MSVVESEKGGELLYCGSTCWEAADQKKKPKYSLVSPNLVSPTRLRPLVGVDIRFVATFCAAHHCVALDVKGRCYTWGRNRHGQLGHGDRNERFVPTMVSELSKYKIVRAGVGRNHTVVVTEDGQAMGFGFNKLGQLGTGSVKEIEASPVRCLVSQVKTTACGGDFTVWLTSINGASIMTAGFTQYGQLGHGTDDEYNIEDSSTVKLSSYEAQPRPRAIASLSGETIVKVACGPNHTVAVDSNGYVYTWGSAAFGSLGHGEYKREWRPRRVDAFQGDNVLPPDAVISAGICSSACTAGGGQLYMWGRLTSASDNWLYPKPITELSGCKLHCMDSGNMHHFAGADNSCLSWGTAQHGQLGYGPEGPKSFEVPKKVDILEGMHVIGVACGLCLSMVIVDRTNVADRLDQLDVYDGQNYAEGRKRPESQPRPAVIGCSLETSMVNVDRSDVANQLDLLDGHGCRALIEGSQPAAVRTSKKLAAKRTAKRTAARAFETVHGNNNDGGDDTKQRHGEVSGRGHAKGGRCGRC